MTAITPNIDNQALVTDQLQLCNTDNNIVLTRDEQIVYLYEFKGLKQREIAKEFGIAQQTISHIIRQAKKSSKTRYGVAQQADRDISIAGRAKALQLIEGVKAGKISPNSKAASAKTLYEMARLASGDATEIRETRNISGFFDLSKRGETKGN